MDTFEGAVLIADISGFTGLTEVLSSRESAGVEMLTKCMNNFFGQVCSCAFMSITQPSHPPPPLSDLQNLKWKKAASMQHCLTE